MSMSGVPHALVRGKNKGDGGRTPDEREREGEWWRKAENVYYNSIISRDKYNGNFKIYSENAIES